MLCVTGTLVADESSRIAASSEILFVRRIAPLLQEKCLGCHGREPDDLQGDFDVRTHEGVMRGGESGEPSLVAGKPEQSPFWLAVTREDDAWSAMPPKEAERLTDEQLAWVRDWITTGAAWPSTERQRELEAEYADKWSTEDGVTVATSGGLSDEWTLRKYDSASLWAYHPVSKPSITQAELANRSAIDVLIEAALPEGLEPAPLADRRTLIRRATYDLTGLPPTPEEVRAFLDDSREDETAFAAVVDRLLASPHYGERMAQHWLDVTRYADSSGFANDFERGNAWRYRDYVIRSFNEDKPFDQFTLEQIAGDELDPDDPEMRIAVGFLRMGPWELTGMEVARIARQRFLDDVTNSVGETFLGHTLQCARCHDHKFDPVPTRDYYSIQSVFATTQLVERPAEFLPTENTAGFDERKYLELRRAEYERTLESLDEVLLANALQWYADQGLNDADWKQAVALAKGKRKFDAARAAMRKRNLSEDQYPPKLVGFTPEQFGRERVARKGLARLSWEFDRYEPIAFSVYNGHTPSMSNVASPLRLPDNIKNGELEQTAILTGGDPFSPGAPVLPGVLSVIADQVKAQIPTTVTGRRLAFARWVADPSNPLTTRVIANRLWQWHFGRGLAGNANNFGSTGQRPTHPKLLDWLAATLVEEGWSVKAMHRRIMLSATYRRASQQSDASLLRELDPTGTSHAAFRPRRLSAEELRDSMLAVSGELNRTLGGIPCRPDINQEVALQPRMVMGTFAAAWTPNPLPQQRNRRSIYILKLRGLLDPMLEVFNSPAPDFSCERRESSTVTPQVFSLFNSQNSATRALALAQHVVDETSDDLGALSRCFELLLARVPTADEQREFLDHWRAVESSLPSELSPWPTPPHVVVREAVEENTGEHFTFAEPLYSNRDYVRDLQPADADAHVRALADVCLVLLNCNEFVYVE
ncbi:MAG: PSD1 domain-containing protein [Planctomycetaceae bacterium]|nr:PSD1 domain-containing protein [Planctomycetaceae bacterium]